MSFISPNFTYGELENASHLDLVDVFEDRMRNWLMESIACLLTLDGKYVLYRWLRLSSAAGVVDRTPEIKGLLRK